MSRRTRSGPPRRRLQAMVGFRLLPTERSLLEAVAEERRVTVSDLTRRLVLRALTQELAAPGTAARSAA